MAKDRENNPFVEGFDIFDQSDEHGGPENEKNERKVKTMLQNHSSYTCDIFQGEDKEQGDSKSIGDQNDEDERPEVSNDDGTNSDFMSSSKERMVKSQRFWGKYLAFVMSLQGHNVKFEVLWKEVNLQNLTNSNPKWIYSYQLYLSCQTEFKL